MTGRSAEVARRAPTGSRIDGTAEYERGGSANCSPGQKARQRTRCTEKSESGPALPGREKGQRVTTIDQMCEEDESKESTSSRSIPKVTGWTSARSFIMIASGRIFAFKLKIGDTFLHTRYHFADHLGLSRRAMTFYRVLRHGLTRRSRHSYRTCRFTRSPTSSACAKSKLPRNPDPQTFSET